MAYRPGFEGLHYPERPCPPGLPFRSLDAPAVAVVVAVALLAFASVGASLEFLPLFIQPELESSSAVNPPIGHIAIAGHNRDSQHAPIEGDAGKHSV